MRACAMSIPEAAVLLAQRGFAVLPLKPAGKAPLLTNGVRGASRDPEQVQRWFRIWRNANLGLATGNGVPPVRWTRRG